MSDPLERHIEAFRDTTDRARLSPAERAAVLAAIETKGGRLPRAGLLGVATVCAIAVVVVAVLVFMQRSPERSWYAADVDPGCVGKGDEIVVSDSCSSAVIAVGDDRIDATAGTRVAREGGRLRLRSGKARFTVAHRRAGDAPFELVVSHGTVRVLGTVFTVEQREAEGALRLETGSVEIVWRDGSPPTRVAPGESVAWPKAEVPPPEPEKVDAAPEPQDRRDAPGTLHANERDAKAIDAIMQKELQLRAQRRYRDAIALLSQAAKRPGLPSVQGERFEFEIGHLLELDDRPVEACVQWRTFARRFPRSARRAEVRERLESCPSQ